MPHKDAKKPPLSGRLLAVTHLIYPCEPIVFRKGDVCKPEPHPAAR